MTKAGAAERSVKVEDLLPQQPLRVAAEELTDAALTESTDDGAVTFSVWTAPHPCSMFAPGVLQHVSMYSADPATKCMIQGHQKVVLFLPGEHERLQFLPGGGCIHADVFMSAQTFRGCAWDLSA